MTSTVFRTAAILALAVAASAIPAYAQAIPIVPSGADGRFERQIDPKMSVPGVDAASLRRFRAAIDQIIAQLADMPSVNSPPAPACHRLSSFVETTRPHGVLSASVSVLSPIGFENGRCHRMTGGGIELYINRTQAAFEPSRADVEDAENGRAHWFRMDARTEGQRISLPSGTILLTNGTPLLTPVSARRYAAEQIRRWREDGASPADPARPWTRLSQRLDGPAGDRQACLDERMISLELTDACLPARRIWELNPDYFDTGRVGAPQLIVLRTPQGRYHGESDIRWQARQAALAALDLERLAALLRR